MQVKQLNIWDYKEQIDEGSMMLCITTNGAVNSKGLAVMGRGVALQAKNHYPGLSNNLGAKITRWGGIPYGGVISITPRLFSFPVKHHWKDNKADLSLIKWATQVLETFMRNVNSDRIVLLPRPGCGNGGLDWEDVEPIVSRLSDKVWVVTNE